MDETEGENDASEVKRLHEKRSERCRGHRHVRKVADGLFEVAFRHCAIYSKFPNPDGMGGRRKGVGGLLNTFIVFLGL